MDASQLTQKEKRAALASLVFLTRKLDETIKAHTCVDGSVQCKHIAKEATAPTGSTDSIFVQALIDAIQRREVWMLDIPGAFLHAL